MRQVQRMTQYDLEPYKVKLPYMCITTVPASQISLRFALQPTVSRYRTFYNFPLIIMLKGQNKKKKILGFFLNKISNL